MNEDLLRTQLHASLDALTPTSRSAQSLRTAGRRRRRLREGAVALTVVALLGGVALSLTGSDDHAALQPADPTPTATAPSGSSDGSCPPAPSLSPSAASAVPHEQPLPLRRHLGRVEHLPLRRLLHARYALRCE